MTLRTYLDHYVRPAEYDDALRRLTDLRRLVLASPAGTGRDAAAVNLLTDAGAPRCYKITDLDGVHAGDWTPPDPGAGYLVDLGVLAKGGGALASGGVDESWIEATAARVTAAGCFLVVLTGPPAARSSKPPPTRRTCWSRSATSTPWRCWSAGYWVRSRLGIVASEPELHEPVWELLESWSREGGSGFQQRLRLTAADTVGSPFGSVRPERSLDLLARVLGDPEWRGLVTVAHSLLRLAELGREDEVLSALLEWSRPQDDSAMVAQALSVSVFIMLAPVPWTHVPGGVPGRPLFIADNMRHRRHIEELWARALARRPAQTHALDALRDFLDEHADRERDALAAMRTVLTGVAARGERHHRRLDWYLGRWADDPDRPSRSAATLYHALTDRPGPRRAAAHDFNGRP